MTQDSDTVQAPLNSDPEESRLNRYIWSLAILWTVVVLASLSWNLIQERQATEEAVRIQAREAFHKDVLYRRWNALSGGVYAVMSDRIQPNPHLDVAERDIQTPSGRPLTLINPAYMTRLVHELGRATSGTQGHITSLNPIRPENAADPWEVEALQAFEKGETEKSDLGVLAGVLYMRLMRPLLTENACLKCHAVQGYEVGDIRGGISISIPMASWQAIARDRERELMLGHGGLWVLGLIGLVLGRRRIVRGVRTRQQAEEALRESEYFLRESQRVAHIGYYVFEITTGLWISSEIQDEIFGIDRDYSKDVEGWLQIVHPEQRAEMSKYLTEEVLAKHRPFDKEYRIRRVRSMDVRWVHGLGELEFDNDGNPVRMIGTIQDITEQKRMEEDLRRAHNLESLGLLAGGVAHDFNNVLTGVTGNLSLLERLLDKDSTEYEIAQEAQQAASKTKGLTQQLMTFSRGGAPVKEIASIEELISETTALSLRGSNTRPEFHFSNGLSSVDIDTGQIGQVIQNLVLNADQAMPNGGMLRISAENVEVSNEGLLPLESGTYIKVSVEDQGIGISEDLLSQVFDPYFSTKETGHGLGLSICHSIIQRHNGHITVTSQQNVGTMFEFYLPASEKQAVTVTETEQELARGTGRILLMDDEETIHRMVGMTLKMLGYEVESVYAGDEALQAYKAALETDQPFDVVIMVSGSRLWSI